MEITINMTMALMMTKVFTEGLSFCIVGSQSEKIWRCVDDILLQWWSQWKQWWWQQMGSIYSQMDLPIAGSHEVEVFAFSNYPEMHWRRRWSVHQGKGWSRWRWQWSSSSSWWPMINYQNIKERDKGRGCIRSHGEVFTVSVCFKIYEFLIQTFWGFD